MHKLFAALLLSVLPLSASANLVQNPGFEYAHTYTNGGPFIEFKGITTSYTDWTFSYAAFNMNEQGTFNPMTQWYEVISSNGCPPNQGNMCADNGGFALVSDQAKIVFKLEADGNTYYAGALGFNDAAATFTFNGGVYTTALTFGPPLAYGDFNVLINHVKQGSLQAIPEPETYAMLLAGLGVIGAVARRRKLS